MKSSKLKIKNKTTKKTLKIVIVSVMLCCAFFGSGFVVAGCSKIPSNKTNEEIIVIPVGSRHADVPCGMRRQEQHPYRQR